MVGPIGGNGSASSLRLLSQHSSRINETIGRIASGERITKAADGAATTARIERLNADIKAFGQALRNTSDGASTTAVADVGLEAINEEAQEIRELALQASNDTLNDDDRQAIQEEVNQRLGQIRQIVASTEFNGTPLLDGTAGTLSFGTDADGGGIALSLDAVTADGLGISTVDVTSAGAARISVDSLDSAIAKVSKQRSRVGATENRLDVRAESLRTQAVEQLDLRGRLADADLAKEQSHLIRDRILEQGATAAFSHQSDGNIVQKILGG